MLYVFIVDTSGSMNQIFSNKLSYLSVVKCGIEHFFQVLIISPMLPVEGAAAVEWEVRRSDRKSNKYALIDYADPPSCLKAGLHDSHESLLEQLKNLQATDMSNPGQAFNAAFDYLNAYRFQASPPLETVGKGRSVGSIDPTMLLWFTDGGNFTFTEPNGKSVVHNKLNIPGLKSPGAFMYYEPFRWDQKMFTFLLQPDGRFVDQVVKAMSDATNGEVYRIISADHMKRSIDNAMGGKKPPHPDVHPQNASFLRISVTLQMEEISDTSAEARRRFAIGLTPQGDQNTYPFPEAYWVSKNLNAPPARSAIPLLSYSTTDESYVIPNGFVYDRFTIDQAPWQELIQKSAVRAKSTTSPLCWTVFARNCGRKEGLGDPIGFIKVSGKAKDQGVMLYLMPYNFPKLFKLIDKLNKNPQMKHAPPPQWHQEFRNYLIELPPYYHPKLKIAMGKLGLDHLMPLTAIPDMTAWPILHLAGTITDQAKVEFSKYTSSVSNKSRIKHEEIRRAAIQTSRVVTVDHLVENAFDVSRSDLLTELKQLHSAFNAVAIDGSANSGAKFSQRKIQKKPTNQDEEDDRCSVPIAEMGNYQTKVQAAPLRNPFESDDDVASKTKRDPFGNPWVTQRTSPKNGTSVGSNDGERDEITNEASLLKGGDQVVKDARAAADSANASAHSRRRSKKGGMAAALAARTASMNGSTSGISAYADSFVGGDDTGSEMTGVETVGGLSLAVSRKSSVISRVPSLVKEFPILVLPPRISFAAVKQEGSIDLGGWISTLRSEGEKIFNEQERLEQAKKEKEEAAAKLQWVEKWRVEAESQSTKVTAEVQPESIDNGVSSPLRPSSEIRSENARGSGPPTPPDNHSIPGDRINNSKVAQPSFPHKPSPQFYDGSLTASLSVERTGVVKPNARKLSVAQSVEDDQLFDRAIAQSLASSGTAGDSLKPIKNGNPPSHPVDAMRSSVVHPRHALPSAPTRRQQSLDDGGSSDQRPKKARLNSVPVQSLNPVNFDVGTVLKQNNFSDLQPPSRMRNVGAPQNPQHQNGVISRPASNNAFSHLYPAQPVPVNPAFAQLQGRWTQSSMPAVSMPDRRGKVTVCLQFNQNRPCGGTVCQFPHFCAHCACVGQMVSHRAVDAHPEYRPFNQF
ncbi:hypothetical protein CcCBS67573_g06614 [Chytriomyces confervae]|uniref:Uncharacterized protein n=1 Tax=Chytriomyces confervae TaxID=246404 RepID=A0A507F4B1_9FUNG|nr:hypothetical protein CcCBS67573_g06614 [Chytriomyces confervae]